MSQFIHRFRHVLFGWLLLGTCAALMSETASAQVYKWVDAKGVTHYDGSPPPSSAGSTQTLAIPTAPASTDSSNESWQEKDNAFKSRYDKRKADEAKQDEIDKKAEAAKETACLRAQQRLDFLQTYGRIYHVDTNGNRVFETDDQREQGFRQRACFDRSELSRLGARTASTGGGLIVKQTTGRYQHRTGDTGLLLDACN